MRHVTHDVAQRTNGCLHLTPHDHRRPPVRVPACVSRHTNTASSTRDDAIPYGHLRQELGCRRVLFQPPAALSDQQSALDAGDRSAVCETFRPGRYGRGLQTACRDEVATGTARSAEILRHATSAGDEPTGRQPHFVGGPPTFRATLALPDGLKLIRLVCRRTSPGGARTV